jgi:hypothetical protein
MYKNLLWLPFLLIMTTSINAQNRAVIKGSVIDSVTKQRVELATVAVLNMKDTASALVSYTVTDNKGQFTLHNLPAGVPLKVLITFVAYKPYRKLLTLNKAEIVDLGSIVMSAKQMSEVTITGERVPIIIKKDTVEFNAEAFKTRPNAVVEELLKKLPGIEVDNQGNIMFNGKKVNKILIDGREFFASDIRIASKNLDAELIDKIQVYDDRENDPDHLLDETRVEKIVNLKFKKKLKKSTFGKVYAGGGTQGRYESGGLFNLFRDTLQISLLGLSNNLSNTGFSYNDYQYTGLNRGGDAISRGGGISFGGYGQSGIQQTTSGGININNDYGKKLKVNTAYYYSHNDNHFNSMNTRDQQTSNIDFITNTITGRLRTDNKHNVSVTVRSQPNQATQINYTPFFTYTDNNTINASQSASFNNVTGQVNKTDNTGKGTGNNLQFQQTFTYNKQLKTKGSSFNVDHNLSINPDNSDTYDINALTSYVSNFPSYTLNRYGYNRNNNINANINFSFRYPIGKKIIADVNFGPDYSRSINRTSTFDFNQATGKYDIFLLQQSSDLSRSLWKQHITPGITYNIRDNLSFVVSLAFQLQQVNNQFARNIADIDQNYFDILPNARLSFSNHNHGNYSFSYQQSVTLPNIGDEIPYTVVFSPLFSVTGNPDLKRGTRHNLSFNFTKYNQQAQSSLNLNTGFSLDENGIFRQRTINADGAETSMPINKSGRFSSSVGLNFSKRFKKQHDLQLSSGTGLNLSQGHNFFEINHQEGYQNQYNASINERLSINWKDIITLDPSANLNQSVSYYSGVNYNDVSNTTFSFDTPYTIYWPAHTDISGTYTFTYNPLVSPGFTKTSNLLNVSIARQFLKKDRAEVKLSCYDILNQAISSYRSIYENVTTNTQSQIVSRYFLLTLRWKFNTAKVAESKSSTMPMIRMR